MKMLKMPEQKPNQRRLNVYGFTKFSTQQAPKYPNNKRPWLRPPVRNKGQSLGCQKEIGTANHQRTKRHTTARANTNKPSRACVHEALTLGVSLIAVCSGMCIVGHSPGAFPVR